MVRRQKNGLWIAALSAMVAAAVIAPPAAAQQANTPISAGQAGVAPTPAALPQGPTAPKAPSTGSGAAIAAGHVTHANQDAGNPLRRLAESQLKRNPAPSKSGHASQSGSTSNDDSATRSRTGDLPLGDVSTAGRYAGESDKKLGGTDSGGGKADARLQKLGSDASTSGWVLNTLAALGVIIGLILLLRWAWAKMGGRVIASNSPAVEVLSRTAVAPKNHVLLLRVGQRLLVVGDSSAGLRTLSQIDDPQEVADLLTAVTSQKDQSISKNFTQLLSRFNGDYDKPRLADEGGDDSEVIFDRTRDRISGLANRIRTFAQRNRAG